ncbi:hypothetical protein RMATCC62417_14003 [Rhizopus microsporus]|nr:hypothetical protein RMATCC62417_14003 [Rhizopus microsporus]
MCIQGWESRELFFAGVNRHGYWTSKDMKRQLREDAIPLFEKLHPNFQVLFVFDQPSNHNAYAKNAKVATKFNLNDKMFNGVKDVVIAPGWFLRVDGTKYPYHFYDHQVKMVKTYRGGQKEVQVWYMKGARRILEERGLGRWEELKRQGKHWNAKRGSTPVVDGSCYPFHMLAAQSDFVEQKTMLHQVITDAGHLFSLYPKYYYETNWIERYWGAAEICKKEYNYSYKAFRDNLEGYLDRISPPDAAPVEIRRYYNRYWRYIAVYSQEASSEKVFSIVRKLTSKRFHSHRRIENED